jgi:hypothetical protein
MATASDLIRASLRLINVLDPGEGLSGLEGDDALQTLNNMLDSWSIEKLAVLSTTRRQLTLTPGTATYTIGSGGTFDVARPIRIDSAGLLINSASSDPEEIPLRVVRSSDEWSRQHFKASTSELPSMLYYQMEYPLGKINLYRVPSSAAHALIIYAQDSLTAVAALTTDLVLAPGYYNALKFNLAIDLAPEYGAEPSQVVIARAADYKAAIKLLNLEVPELALDPAIMMLSGNRNRSYNVLTD